MMIYRRRCSALDRRQALLLAAGMTALPNVSSSFPAAAIQPPFCGVVDVIPPWAFSIPWEEKLVPTSDSHGTYRTWVRIVGSKPNPPKPSFNPFKAPSSSSSLREEDLPILVVHGGPGLSSRYLETLELMGIYRQVVFYDQIGAGLTLKANTGNVCDVSLDRFGPQLAAVHAATVGNIPTGTDRPMQGGYHVYGHGWGGIAILEAAQKGQLPRGVRSVTLASVPGSNSGWIRDRVDHVDSLAPPLKNALLGGDGQFPPSPEFTAALDQYTEKYVCHRVTQAGCLQVTFDNFGVQGWDAMTGGRYFSEGGELKGWKADPVGLERYLEGIPVMLMRGEDDEISAESLGELETALAASQVVRAMDLRNAASCQHIDNWEPHLEQVKAFHDRAEGKTEER